MTEVELKKLNRAELLTMLMSVTQKCEDLEEQLKEANDKLANRSVKIEEAGSLAEAMIKVNGVLEAADRAAAEYLENIRTQNASMLADVQHQKERYMAQARNEYNDYVAELRRQEAAENEKTAAAKAKAEEENAKLAVLRRQVEEQEAITRNLEAARQERMAMIEQETKKRCAAMVEAAKAESQTYWDEVYTRLKEYCAQNESLRSMLSHLGEGK